MENDINLLGKAGILSRKQNNTIIKIIIMTVVLFIYGFSISLSQVTDYDGNKYNTLIIGTQEWMVENLNVEHYRNGDVIPQVQGEREWEKLTTGAWCYYENKTENGIIYGKLYNWYAVNDSRGLAPEGWHIPNNAEWKQLTEYLGGKEKKIEQEGLTNWITEDVGGRLKARTLWESPNTGATNESGFSAFPGGNRDIFGDFNRLDTSGFFWSSSENYSYTVWNIILKYNDSDCFRYFYFKEGGLSVRCIKD